MNTKQRRLERRKLMRAMQPVPSELWPHPTATLVKKPKSNQAEADDLRYFEHQAEAGVRMGPLADKPLTVVPEVQAHSEAAQKLADALAGTKADADAVVAPVVVALPPRFQPGQVVKLTSAEYGVRYKGLTVTVLNQVDDATWAVQSTKRKSPLVVAQEHLAEVETKKAA